MANQQGQKINVWQDYRVRWDFQTDIFGSFPASEDVMGAFIEKKMKDKKLRPTRVEVTDNGVVEVLEYVANGVANNEMSKSQADPINTTCKLKLNLLNLKAKYVQMFIEAFKPRIKAGEMDPDALIEKMPKFFNHEEKEFLTIEKKEGRKVVKGN